MSQWQSKSIQFIFVPNLKKLFLRMEENRTPLVTAVTHTFKEEEKKVPSNVPNMWIWSFIKVNATRETFFPEDEGTEEAPRCSVALQLVVARGGEGSTSARRRRRCRAIIYEPSDSTTCSGPVSVSSFKCIVHAGTNYLFRWHLLNQYYFHCVVF